MPIETEADWLVCVEPREFVAFGNPRFTAPRFRWLAVSWGEKVRCYLQPQDELLYYEAYKAWVEGRAGHPSTQNLPVPWSPLDRPIEPVFYARYFMDSLYRDQPIQMAANAAESLCREYHQTHPDRFNDHVHEQENKSEAELALAQEEADERWKRKRKAHRERTLWQFANEFRDVAGNPFRPVAFDPAWRTETVVGLAAGIDEVGAYERLPILADALQEAGCEDEQVLTHARGPGPHVRGCWLIDMVLGRWQAA